MTSHCFFSLVRLLVCYLSLSKAQALGMNLVSPRWVSGISTPSSRYYRSKLGIEEREIEELEGGVSQQIRFERKARNTCKEAEDKPTVASSYAANYFRTRDLLSTPRTQMPQSQVSPTPLSKGSGSRLDSISEAYSDPKSHTQEGYEEYLKHDIERELSFDDFMKVILDCADWSSKHLAAANLTVEDPKIKKLLEAYRTVSGHETNYYHPFVELANGVLEKNTTNNQDDTSYCRNDLTFIAGSFGERKPDVITTLKRLILQTRISADARSKKGPEEYPFHWAELIAFVEFKKDDIAPQPESTSSSSRAPKYSASGSRTGTSKKRSATDTHPNSPNKRARTATRTQSYSSNKRVKTATKANSYSSNEHLATGLSKEDVKVQCASYALQMLSNGGLRTHVLGLLVSKDLLQLLYFDRSLFIISQPFNFIENARDFVALLLVLEGLSDTQWGFVHGFDVPSSSSELRLPSKYLFSKKSMQLTNGPVLRFGEILSRHHGLIGRGTCVIRASVVNPPADRKPVVAVKISPPASSRRSETEILENSRRKVIGEHTWVLSHLPEVLHHEDLDLVDSPRHKLFRFFDDPDVYELRALRLLIFDELRPITELTTAAVLAKAFREIFKCYEWLYQTAGILHQDISIYNLMYRRKGEEICGVLNDFDLAAIKGDSSPSSKQRTGTKPYMAIDLLTEEEGDPVVHSYRHDLESLFYVILILTSSFENGKVISDPPLQEWVSFDSERLANAKLALIAKCRKLPPLTESYTGFIRWLEPMCAVFTLQNVQWAFSDLQSEEHVTFDAIAKILENDVTI